jgi:hypothetical protein
MQLSISSLLSAAFALFSACECLADGLPYHTSDSGKRAMIGDFVALTISQSQIVEISKTGVISFDEQQLKKLHVFYPTFPAKAGVASSTFNDNLERFEASVDVIWWYADEVRIPLVASRTKKPIGMPSQNAWTPESQVLTRLAPDGTPYLNGKETSYLDVLAAIDALAAKASPNTNERHSMRVIVPPPHRGWAEANAKIVKQLGLESTDLDPNKVIPRIYEFLETYAHAKGIGLSKCW